MNVSTVFFGLMAKIIWNTNMLILNCEQQFNILYRRHTFIRKPTDFIYQIKNTVCDFFDNSLKEPERSCWSVFYIMNDNKIKPLYNNIIFDNEQQFNQHNAIYNTILSNQSDKNNVCFISKYNDKYRVFHSEINNESELKPSECTFLSIFYKHPDMDDTIQLDIPSEMLLADNMLFNATFVLRCLQMQKMNYVFDKRYSIIIMDSDLNEYNITYGNYLHLYQDRFEMKSV